MIDLHIHSTYSDGTDTVKDILRKAQEKKLEVISITDHNSCMAYLEIDGINPASLYDGKIIAGAEFTTHYKGRFFEVLGYGFDYLKMAVFLNDFYDPQKIQKETSILYQRLLDIIHNLGLVFSLEQVREPKFESEFFERRFYEELIKHPENKEILPEKVWDSFSDFFRNGITNPQSKLFLNSMEFKPSLSEIIQLIHQNGGKVFLAHPFQYQWNDIEDFLNDLYANNDFDGIECFYTTFSNQQTDFLLLFAEKHNLLVSGGSDYHGLNKKQHDLAIGNGSLAIHEDILSNWGITYYQNEEIRNAVKVFIFQDDTVLCVKYNQMHQGYIDIPGGKIKTNETDIEAILRKAKEETGLNVTNLEFKGTVITNYPSFKKKFVLSIYTTRTFSGSTQNSRIFSTCWIPINELISYDKRFPIACILDEKYRDCFKKQNFKINFICDENHHIINSFEGDIDE
ncbi:MAG: NUDIX domain-containing protein [Bacilli bacterium]|nr:NUDIX domain-containing protein [Bacilli bacterium]